MSEASVETSTPIPTQFATFKVGDMLFGIDVMTVQEVLRAQQMTPVPLAPKEVEGLINLRGQIITAIDLRTRLGLPARPEKVEPMNLIVRVEDNCLSLLVDEIGDVLELDESIYESNPRTLQPSFKALINGVFKLEDELLLILNTEKAVTIKGTNAGSQS